MPKLYEHQQCAFCFFLREEIQVLRFGPAVQFLCAPKPGNDEADASSGTSSSRPGAESLSSMPGTQAPPYVPPCAVSDILGSYSVREVQGALRKRPAACNDPCARNKLLLRQPRCGSDLLLLQRPSSSSSSPRTIRLRRLGCLLPKTISRVSRHLHLCRIRRSHLIAGTASGEGKSLRLSLIHI